MEHTFKITNLTRVIESGLVNKVKFKLETTHEGFHSSFASATKISGSIDDENFIEYDNLTEEIVLGWITGSLPVASMQHYNSSSIADQISSYVVPTQNTGTPWESN